VWLVAVESIRRLLRRLTMNRQVWETLLTALQAWEGVDFNATDKQDYKNEYLCFDEAVDYLLSVEPKDN
jgi:hypothetical protein